MQPDKQVPGPGTYRQEDLVGKDAQNITFKRRLTYGDPDIVAKKKDVPDPGQYQTLEMKADGKYPVSSYKNTS